MFKYFLIFFILNRATRIRGKMPFRSMRVNSRHYLVRFDQNTCTSQEVTVLWAFWLLAEGQHERILMIYRFFSVQECDHKGSP